MATVDIFEAFLATAPPAATVDVFETYLETKPLGSSATVDVFEVNLTTKAPTAVATVQVFEVYLSMQGDTSGVHEWIADAAGVLHPVLEEKILNAHGVLIG